MDKTTLAHLCELSKLDYPEDQQDAVIAQMDDIIALMDTVKEYDVTYDDTEALWLLPLTQEDTRLLPSLMKRVYMDTRITFPDGAIPATNIVDLSVTETLFGGDSA